MHISILFIRCDAYKHYLQCIRNKTKRIRNLYMFVDGAEQIQAAIEFTSQSANIYSKSIRIIELQKFIDFADCWWCFIFFTYQLQLNINAVDSQVNHRSSILLSLSLGIVIYHGIYYDQSIFVSYVEKYAKWSLNRCWLSVGQRVIGDRLMRISYYNIIEMSRRAIEMKNKTNTIRE